MILHIPSIAKFNYLVSHPIHYTDLRGNIVMLVIAWAYSFIIESSPVVN